MLTAVYPVCCLALALAYAGIVAAYWRGWHRLNAWQVPAGYAPRTSVTVLIPARNEGACLVECLESVLANTYPKDLLEILVIDDWSEDDTAAIAGRYATRGQVRLIRLSEESPAAATGKKAALTAGVQAASGHLIATTDADCVVPPDWLMLLTSMYELEKTGAITGPVMSHREKNLLHYFQALDLAGLALVTGAGLGLGWHRMGNGANLCFTRSVFQAVGGYAGNESLASGDDLFLLQKIARTGRPVRFLKNPDATVRTEPCPDWRSFAQQRLRWGTKNAALPETSIRLILAVALLLCCTILANLILLPYRPPFLVGVLGVQIALKAIADYTLLRDSCRYLRRQDAMRWFVPGFLLHTVYIAVAGLGSLLCARYTWKGRNLR